MTTIKITDLNGAKEALPQKVKETRTSCVDEPYAICRGINKSVRRIQKVHLEVDVGAMTGQIGQIYCLPQHSDKIIDSSLLLDIVDKLSKSPDKWTRLVRK